MEINVPDIDKLIPNVSEIYEKVIALNIMDQDTILVNLQFIAKYIGITKTLFYKNRNGSRIWQQNH